MGQLCFILGRSGTGKSYSLRNFDPSAYAVINVQGKILPFKGSGKVEMVSCDDSDEIVDHIRRFAKKYKIIVVDDFQYVMANEFMRRAMERGYDKFTEIARHAWDIADCVRSLPNDVIVYIMCHTDVDSEGLERLKTIGKLLDEKIVLEGMSTIVLKTNVSDGKYSFLTQNNGKDTTKSPAGMFPSYAIDNDLKYVDDKIRSYYEFDGAKSEEEMAAEDEAVRHDDVKPEEKKKRRGRRSKEETEEPMNPPTSEEESKEPEEPEESEESESKPVKRRRSITKEKEEAKAKELNDLVNDVPDGEDEVPFDKLPTRKNRDESEDQPVEPTPTRRRRRRV